MKERIKFVLEWDRRFEASQGRRMDVAELCRRFGVSRQTGYLWIRRYREANRDLRAMDDRSRRPHTHPHAVSLADEDIVVAARKKFPRWGPRTLRRWLVDRNPGKPVPSHSCISNILKRRGLTLPRGRRRRGVRVEVTSPFPECTAVNQVWCIDFKGWFRTLDCAKCYPLTLLDAFSRFLLRCEALDAPTGDLVERVLDSAFREYGLPRVMRSDGGPPFAGTHGTFLSTLMVWLLRLGITVEIIAPASPQQNGRLERFHRTLAADVPPAESIRTQQRAFDRYRALYNLERPHHALSLNTPGSIYRRSKLPYPRNLLTPSGGGHFEVVDRYGFIRWHRRKLFISEALAGEVISLWPEERTRWLVCFGCIEVGYLDQADRMTPLRRPKGTLRLSLLDED